MFLNISIEENPSFAISFMYIGIQKYTYLDIVWNTFFSSFIYIFFDLIELLLEGQVWLGSFQFIKNYSTSSSWTIKHNLFFDWIKVFLCKLCRLFLTCLNLFSTAYVAQQYSFQKYLNILWGMVLRVYHETKCWFGFCMKIKT